MAVVQYSALVTQLRGKLAGSQFNKNKTGYSLQSKSTPTRRQSPAQIRQRQAIGLVQRTWASETDARRNQATQAANSNPTSDRFGNQVALSGYNQYVKMMSWRLLTHIGGTPVSIGDPIITTPVAAGRLDITNLVLQFNGYDSNGRLLLRRSFDRNIAVTPTGGNASSRAYLFLIQTDENGRILTNAREVFFSAFGFSMAHVALFSQPVHTSWYFAAGQYYLFRVYSRNLYAGAETAFSEQLVQI